MLLRRFEGGTNRDIALLIIEHKGWDAEDRELVAKIADSVKSAKQYRARMDRTRPHNRLTLHSPAANTPSKPG